MKVASLQTELIDCLDDRLEQCSKTVRDEFHLLIEWLLAEIIIDISHQVDQTLLLRTIKAVVRGVKVRYQNAAEMAKYLLRGFTLPSFSIDERLSDHSCKVATLPVTEPAFKIKKIVVPTDLTKESETALRYAISLARGLAHDRHCCTFIKSGIRLIT
jgi:hypothetical protein